MKDLTLFDIGSVSHYYQQIQNRDGTFCTYPAHVRIHKSPPHSIFPNILHLTTSVQENTQHAFAEVDDGRVFLSLGRFGSVIRHSMLFWDRGDNKGGMKVDERLS